MTSPNFKAFVVTTGALQMHGSFGMRTVVPGELVLMAPDLKVESVALAPAEVFTAYFHPGFVIEQLRWLRPFGQFNPRSAYREVLDWTGGLRSVALSPDTAETVSAQFARLGSATLPNSHLGGAIARAAEFISMVNDIARDHRPFDSNRLDDLKSAAARDDVARVLHQIHEGYSSAISVAGLAASVSLTESALRRAVVKATGLSPRQYLHRVRLARYEQLVLHTTMPLAEAAHLSGWASASYARSVFVHTHGASPRDCRAQAQRAKYDRIHNL